MIILTGNLSLLKMRLYLRPIPKLAVILEYYHLLLEWSHFHKRPRFGTGPKGHSIADILAPICPIWYRKAVFDT